MENISIEMNINHSLNGRVRLVCKENTVLFESIDLILSKSSSFLEDHHLSKALVRLLFKLTSKISNHAPLLRKVAMDIHGQCEDVSEDAKFVHQPYFAIINEKTHMVILNNIVLVELERMINSLEWIIQTQILSNEQITHFCGQLSYSMTTFGQILQCRLKNKMTIINIVKILTKLYTILDEFTRQVLISSFNFVFFDLSVHRRLKTKQQFVMNLKNLRQYPVPNYNNHAMDFSPIQW